MPLLSVVVPVYNEEKTIKQIIDKIKSTDIDKEIIIIDNYSIDNTRQILQSMLAEPGTSMIKVIYHSFNKGKGSSVRTGIAQAKGDYVVIQDADLEYDPNEYRNLLKPLLEKQADLTLGARFVRKYSGLYAHRLGNKILTGFLNFLFGSHINDYATCYKMARKDTFTALALKSKSFDIEVEIVCKALKKHLRITEVPISYYPRVYAEGKKIRWKDGLEAILSIIKYKFNP